MDNEENQELTETAEAEATTADARVEEVAVMDEAPATQEGEGATEDAGPSKSKKSKSSPIVMRPDLLEEGEYTPDEYEEMLAMYEDTLSEIAEGEIVKATILRTTESAVILDVGFKSEGAVPLDEFRDPVRCAHQRIQPLDAGNCGSRCGVWY